MIVLQLTFASQLVESYIISFYDKYLLVNLSFRRQVGSIQPKKSRLSIVSSAVVADAEAMIEAKPEGGKEVDYTKDNWVSVRGTWA